MRPSQRERDQLVEYSSLKLHSEKVGVVRKQRWIQILLDRRQVERIVFQPRMYPWIRMANTESGSNANQRKRRPETDPDVPARDASSFGNVNRRTGRRWLFRSFPDCNTARRVPVPDSGLSG